MNEHNLTATIHQRLKIHEKHSVLISAILISAFVLLPIPNDIFFIKTPWILALAIGLRSSSAILMWLYYYAYRSQRIRMLYMVIIPILALLALGVEIMLDLTRPRDYLLSSIPVFVIISFYYFMMYSPLPFKIIPAVVISSEQIGFLLFYKDIPNQGALSLAITLIVLNIFGISNAWVLTRLRKRELEAERKLRKEIRFKDALVNASFEALILFRDNRIVDCNQAFLDLTAMPMEEIRIIPMNTLIPLSEEQERELAHDEVVSATLMVQQEIPVEIRQRRMVMATIEYSCLILRDQSGDKLLSATAAAENQDLEPRVMGLPLSHREKEIVLQIVAGSSRFEIAEKLFISDETVKKHTANIYSKLKINSKIDLIHRILEK